jgi:hypothetical protein
MADYSGNVFAEMRAPLDKGRRGFPLTVPQMEQILAERDALIEKANELVRENYRLLAQGEQAKSFT